MPAPVVTVLLPARDAESTVARAVESLLGSTLQGLRVLAVDDGSTDGTRRVLQGLSVRDLRVEVLDGQGHGLAAALQLALSQATSPYVARMDADDEALLAVLRPAWWRWRQTPTWRATGRAPSGVGTRIQGIPVVSSEELGPPSHGVLLVCVGVRWAREALRTDLAARGWVEGMDFLCAA
jgi:glycosyltransferase involved in cell wall biosynthesis